MLVYQLEKWSFYLPQIALIENVHICFVVQFKEQAQQFSQTNNKVLALLYVLFSA